MKKRNKKLDCEERDNKTRHCQWKQRDHICANISCPKKFPQEGKGHPMYKLSQNL